MGDNTNEEYKETYRLWVEYLKRSRKYSLASLWFEVTINQDPILREVVSKVTAQQIIVFCFTYGGMVGDGKIDLNVEEKIWHFLLWWASLGLIELDGELIDLKHLFATYEMVGDVHNDDNSFERIWLRMQEMDELIRQAGQVYSLEKDWVLNSVFNAVGGCVYERLDRELKRDPMPSPDEVMDIIKTGFKEYLHASEMIFTVAICRVSHRGYNPADTETDMEELKEQFGNIINTKRLKLYNSINFRKLGQSLYMVPETTRLNNHLERYLKIYDYCKQPEHQHLGWKKLAGTFTKEYPPGEEKWNKRKGKEYSAITMRKGYERAVQIINNVEQGVFPGKYD